jgi:hypothetical protein
MCDEGSAASTDHDDPVVDESAVTSDCATREVLEILPWVSGPWA